MKDFKIFNHNNFKKSFTLAEILIAMTIIGIVTAVTLPALRGNINDKVWATKRKALQSRMTQALAMLPSLNGYGIDGNDEDIINNSALTFVVEGLNKVYAIGNICDNDHLEDCGIPTKITSMYNTSVTTPKNFMENLTSANANALKGILYNTKAAAFETKNEESIIVYYNPLCKVDDFSETLVNYGADVGNEGNTVQYLCANFIYDLNGTSGPNKFGKDVGAISAFYSVNPKVVAPELNEKLLGNTSFENAVSLCRELGEEYRLPTIEEWMGVQVNSSLFDIQVDGNISRYWSGTQYDDVRAWTMMGRYSVRRAFNKNTSFLVRCLKR